jgi:hypothetical protein
MRVFYATFLSDKLFNLFCSSTLLCCMIPSFQIHLANINQQNM